MSKPMTLTKNGGRVLSSGQTAREVGVMQYHISALAKKGKIEFFLFGSGDRYYDEADLPAIRAACIDAGYLDAPAKSVEEMYADFNVFLASIALDTDLQPLTKHQRENLFELFRTSKPEPKPTTLGAAEAKA